MKEIRESFSFSMNATVIKDENNPFDFNLLSQKEEQRIKNSDEFLIDNYLFLAESDLTTIPEDFKIPIV